MGGLYALTCACNAMHGRAIAWHHLLTCFKIFVLQ